MARYQKYALNYVKESSVTYPQITNKKDAEIFVKTHLSDLPVEKVLVIALDSTNRIIGFTENVGTTNQCAAFPIEVFRFLLSTSAVSFIVAHNHPSNTINVSEHDWIFTKKLQTIGKELSLPLLDHLIITGENKVSLREYSRWDN